MKRGVVGKSLFAGIIANEHHGHWLLLLISDNTVTIQQWNGHNIEFAPSWMLKRTKAGERLG